MTVAYFDSSALVKLVVEEPGSDDVATLWDGADAVVTSRVAYPEVRAALAAAGRAHRLDAAAHERVKRAWERYHAALRLVELTPQLERVAGDLAEEHALSGFDAVHLASVVALSDAPVVVATWDVRLLGAAQAIGMATLPDGL